jgi:hypothetical protein
MQDVLEGRRTHSTYCSALHNTPHHLDMLMETVWWLVTSTGWYVNMGLWVTDRYCGRGPERVINVNYTAV